MSSKVKIKVLAYVGSHKPGDVIEVDEAVAKSMCTVRKKNTGDGLVDFRTAMTMAEVEEIKAQPIDKFALSQGELAMLGIKNVVETPFDPKFDADIDRKVEMISGAKKAKAKSEKEPEAPAEEAAPEVAPDAPVEKPKGKQKESKSA